MMIIRKDYSDDDHPELINVENMPNNEILLKFPIEIRHIIGQLFSNCKIGNCIGEVKITSVYNFQKYEEEIFADSFTLRIPYAGQYINWEIMFSHHDLRSVPDIMFDDDNFLCEPQLLNVLKTNISSFSTWNPYNPDALVQLIREYFSLYKTHNINILSKDEIYSRCNFEYTSLVGDTGVGADEVEVLVEPNAIHFLINLPVDFTSLPVYISKNNEIETPGEDMVILLVTFRDSKIQTRLHLCPHVEHILGNNKCLPPFNSQECLMDYVPIVKKLLTDKVDAIVTNHRMKNEFMNILVTMFSGSIVEYDTLTCSKATLLFENKNFYFLVIVQLGNKFPQENPKLYVRSVYIITSRDKVYTEAINDYPYSPRWKPDEMVQRMFTFVFEYIERFQRNSQLEFSISQRLNI